MNLLALTAALTLTTASGAVLWNPPAPAAAIHVVDMPTIVVRPDAADRIVDFPAIVVRPLTGTTAAG